MFFKGEFYQQAEQLDRELNALWDKYPSLMPPDVYWFRMGRSMAKTWVAGIAAIERVATSFGDAAVSIAGLADALNSMKAKL